MKNKSNITKTKDGFVEKSTGRKIESPLDTPNESESPGGVQPNVRFKGSQKQTVETVDGCFVEYCKMFRPLPMKRLFRVTFKNKHYKKNQDEISDEMYLIADSYKELNEYLQTAIIQKYTQKNGNDWDFYENKYALNCDFISNVEMLDIKLNIIVHGMARDRRGQNPKDAWRNLGYIISA